MSGRHDDHPQYLYLNLYSKTRYDCRRQGWKWTWGVGDPKDLRMVHGSYICAFAARRKISQQGKDGDGTDEIRPNGSDDGEDEDIPRRYRDRVNNDKEKVQISYDASKVVCCSKLVTRKVVRMADWDVL